MCINSYSSLLRKKLQHAPRYVSVNKMVTTKGNYGGVDTLLSLHFRLQGVTTLNVYTAKNILHLVILWGRLLSIKKTQN